VGGRPFAHIQTAAGCTRCERRGFDPWQVNRWPLIELGLIRSDCREWLVRHGHPEPARSACFFCPNRRAGHWSAMRQQRPELWGKAVALDEFLRHGINGLRADAYLHSSGRPLSAVDPEPAPDQRVGEPGREADMDCEAGVCFT
jgi:hypothetical protein